MPACERVVLGILADPEVPADLAREFAGELPDLLTERMGDGRSWEIQVIPERLPVLGGDYRELLEIAHTRRCEQKWDYVICLTDSPLRSDGESVAADVVAAERIAVVSLPAFGGVLLRQRLREVLVEVVAELSGADSEPGLPGEFRRVTPRGDRADDDHVGDGQVTVRIVSARSTLRLLLGMVWANQPWRLVFGLTRALVAALATGAYVLVTSAIWQLADSLGYLRFSVIMVLSVTAMVVWLILDHKLWIGPSDKIPGEQAVLYNTSTVVTLVLGVLFAYAGLFSLSLVVGAFLIDEDFFARHLGHSTGWPDYIEVAWFAASLSVLAGALGSGFDSEESARQAAYGARERERREALQNLAAEQRTT